MFNSLHECLFMFVCWWSLNWCGYLWSLNETWENCGCWWKMNIMMILVKIDVMIPCLLLFWLSFDIYKSMYKFWEQIWVKGDQKHGFSVKIGEFPRGNNQEQGVCSGTTRWTSSSSPWRIAQCRTPCSWVFQVLRSRSGLSKLILLMYLTNVKLSKPMETSNELDWNWFCESNQTFWNCSRTHNFPKLVFLKGKR